MNLAMNLTSNSKEKLHKISLWIIEKIWEGVLYFCLAFLYILKETLKFIFGLIVGGIILYIQLGIITVILVYSLSWFVGWLGAPAIH